MIIYPDGADAGEEIDFESWIRPRQALQMLSPHALSWVTYTQQIVTRLKNDLIDAVAEHAIVRAGSKSERHPFMMIPEGLWSGSVDQPTNPFWTTGDVEFFISQGAGYSISVTSTISLFNVRFRPEHIRAMLPPDADEAADALPRKNRRGAKRKDWWDHLWIEMIRRIRAGTLKPKGVNELEAILEDYARNDLGEDTGDSTLKRTASNLFKYLEESGGK